MRNADRLTRRVSTATSIDRTSPAVSAVVWYVQTAPSTTGW